MGFGRRDKSTVVALSAHRPLPGADDGAVSARTEPEDPDDYRSDVVERVVERTWPNVKGSAKDLLSPDYTRGDRAACIGVILDAELNMSGETLFEAERRDVITLLLNQLMALPSAASEEDKAAAADPAVLAKERVQPLLMERMDVSKAAEMPRAEMATQTSDLVAEILAEEKFHLNLIEQRDLVTMLLNDMLGLGPLEPLLADERVTDIMVNGPDQVFVERGGRLELADVRFRDNAHVLNVAQRIVSAIGRRVDETSPLCDARLADGSRVNVIIPPLAIDGPSISIRKFAKQKITMEKMEQQDNLSPAMATVLRIAGRSRLNIIISGGTGSGKTTLLNALSRMIDPGERIVTIEDAAELQLQQPHVVRLETRPANLEGEGEITQAGFGQELPADAPGSHHPGRDTCRRGIGYVAGHEHRARRIALYDPCQPPPGGPDPPGKHGRHGWCETAERGCALADCGCRQHDRADRPHARRCAAHHAYHRSRRHGG